MTSNISFSNKFEVKNILKYTSIEKMNDDFEDFNLVLFEILENGFYLVILNFDVSSYISIFNPLLTQIVKEKLYENEYFCNAALSENLLVIKRQDVETYYVVIDVTNLKVLKKNDLKVWDLINCDSSFLYFFTEMQGLNIDIYDWNFKKRNYSLFKKVNLNHFV